MQSEIDGMKGHQSEMDELKEKNKFLEAKCCSLERSVKILTKEQKWEYSASNIPRSHWEELGFDEDYIWYMECFLRCIKQVTCDLRNDEVDDREIDLGNPESATALLHDDLLLPHWIELANAMQLYQEKNPFAFKLSIANIQLTNPVIDLLKPVLKQKSIEYINLQNNSFVNGREGIELAVEVMESNDGIQTFFWTRNSINSMEDARYLVEAVNIHPAINTVRLENCFEGDVNGYHIMQSLLTSTSNKNFAEIDLEGNHICTGVALKCVIILHQTPH